MSSPNTPISETEENYLKGIYKLAEKSEEDVHINTNAIADMMRTKAGSVTDMLKRLSDKDLVVYQPYKGVTLSEQGVKRAKDLVRKHRLWEVFLVDCLDYKWDEVHEIAEQLEHIQSPDLTDRLDNFLNHPKFDPHGDPIPDSDGNVQYRKQCFLSELAIKEKGVIVGVKEHDPIFLRQLENQRLLLGTQVQVVNRYEYDNSLELSIEKNKRRISVSHQVSKNIYVKPIG